MPRPASIQARLLAVTLAALAATGIFTAWGSYRNALHEADELFDAQLAQTGETLLALVAHADDDIAREIRRGHRYQQRLLFQVWHDEDGEARLLLRSANAPREPLPAAHDHGFGDGDWQGSRWRFYTVADEEDETHVVVGEEAAVRDELARGVALNTLLPFLAALPLLGLFIFAAVRRGLAPLRALAGELQQRAPDRLEPVQLADPPAELAPVLRALDALFERVAGTLENERRFTADAAHELRTPLAALKAQVQLAALTGDAEERRRALARSEQGIARMTHLVEQLLTLARLEAEAAGPARDRADVARIVAEVCAEAGAAALAKGVELEPDAPQPVPARVERHLVAVAARNLVDNALRYTPAGGHVRVRVDAQDGGARIEVEDDGPGVPEAQRALLGRRFHRLQQGAAEGVGLGLSIVQRIARLHGGRLEFAAAAAGGLRATLRLPAAPQADRA
jgi:two-component system sensor histidine kinase QseC